MRIIYITQTFPPEPGATKRPLRQSVELQRLGHHVTVLTAFPNYPHGRIAARDRWRLWRRDCVDGVDTLRFITFPAPNRGVVRRVLGFASFAAAAIVAGFFVRRADLVIGSVMKPGTELAALAVARIRRCALLLEVRDLPPDVWEQVKQLRSVRLTKALRKYYRWIWARADLIAVSSESMVAPLCERGALPGRILPLPHAADFEEIDCWDRKTERAALGIEDRFVVLYSGSLSAHYCVPTLISAAAILAKSHPSVLVTILGAGGEEERLRVMARTVHNVRLLGSAPPDEVGRYLAAADLFVNPLWYDHVGELVGTKIAEYLAAGRPVLTCTHAPLSNRMIEEAGAGKIIPIGDATALADGIAFYVGRPDEAARAGAAARHLAETRFQRRTIVATFEKVLSRHLGSGCNRKE